MIVGTARRLSYLLIPVEAPNNTVNFGEASPPNYGRESPQIGLSRQAKRIAPLCLPAPAKRCVESHETLILVASRLRQREFSGEKRPLAVQHFEISGGAALVAHDGEAD